MQTHTAMRLAFLALALGTFSLTADLRAEELTVPTPVPTQTARHGLFHLGPLHLTPSFHLGSIGVDTNVFYTATDRRTDITANGGPALRLVIPISQSVRLVGDGGFDYVYFARTTSQRRWVGRGRGGLEWTTERTSAAVQFSHTETFQRPSIEVDRRVAQRDTTLRASLRRRLLGRTSLALAAARSSEETAGGQEFLGTDLSRTLTRDVDAAVAALEYALTIKTSLVVEGAYERSHFLFDDARDADTLRVAAGVRTDASALLAGRALLGTRWFKRRDTGDAPAESLYANVDVTWHISPRTRVGGGYRRDIAYTAFASNRGSPVLHEEAFSARIDKELPHNFDLRLFWRQRHSRTEDAVVLVLDSGEVVESRRDDRSNEYGADLGYHFGRHVRLGVAATYSERRSPFADLGVDGLLVGATILVTPQN